MKYEINHWEEVPLKSILTYSDERVELDDTQEYATITVKRRHGGLEEREKLLGHQIKTKKQFRLVPGAFIISRVQCWHQAYAVVPDNLSPTMIASSNYDQFAISPDVDHRFFWWLSHSPRFTETVRDSAVGVVIEKMVFDRDSWLEKTVFLPPLPEQRRIVARIEELASKINEARGLRQQAAKEAKALIGTELRARFLTFAKGYPVKSLEELTSNIIDGPHVTPHYLPDGFTGIPFVTVKNMVTGELTFDNLHYISEEDHRQFTARCKAEHGDILYSKDGATRGRPCFVDTNREFSFFVSVALIKPLRDRLDGRYLVHLLNSNWIKDLVVNKSRGDMIPHIVLREIRAFPVPLPALSDQHRIVNELDDLQSKVAELKTLQAETTAELEALLPSILDKAFKGEL